MKYIKFYMRNKQEIEVLEEEAKRILQWRHPIMKVQKDGKWTGETINRAFFICTSICHKPDSQLSILNRNAAYIDSIIEKDKAIESKKDQTKTHGELQRIENIDGFKKTWEMFKKQGCYQEINSYEDWRKKGSPTSSKLQKITV